MDIIFNRKSKFSGEIERVLTAAAQQLGAEGQSELYLSFVTPKQIKQLNCDSRGKDEITDVLSFPYIELAPGRYADRKVFPADINPQSGNFMLGEIFICRQRARSQGIQYGHGEQRETVYLALHGFLHLLGYDHMTDDDKKIMRAAEKDVLAKCGY